jgi:hypothetical protein
MISLDERIEREVAALGDLPRDELATLWTKAYGVAPPKGARRVLLERAAAWHIQAKALGGIKKNVLKSLSKASAIAPATSSVRTDSRDSKDTDKQSRRQRSLPSIGARLIREWHGKTHVVDVVQHGYAWQGQTYRSLSEIARAITGARWSGPRFFGL